MKYTVIVGGIPYSVVADNMNKEEGRIWFVQTKCGDDGPNATVAEFKQSKVDGIIMEGENAEE